MLKPGQEYPHPDITVQDVMDFVGCGITAYMAQEKEESAKTQNEALEERSIQRAAATRTLITVFAFCAGHNPEEFLKQFLVKEN